MGDDNNTFTVTTQPDQTFACGDHVSTRSEHQRVYDSKERLVYRIDYVTNMIVDKINKTDIEVTQESSHFEIRDERTGKVREINEWRNIDTLCDLLREQVAGNLPDLSFKDLLDLAEL